ncbi:MAG: acetyltransferase, partial [Myxococcales bacterium]|nr:acetyltransferase [Myxococcales bacterium]
IDDCSHIGAGASVIQSVHIGRDCLVGAGAVALRDAPDGAKVITPITRTTIEEA